MLEPSYSPSASAPEISVLRPEQLLNVPRHWRRFPKTSAPRQGAALQFHSLTGQFSPELCATAPRYTAFKALNFEHLFGAKFEVLSVLQLYSQDKIAGRLAVLS